MISERSALVAAAVLGFVILIAGSLGFMDAYPLNGVLSEVMMVVGLLMIIGALVVIAVKGYGPEVREEE